MSALQSYLRIGMIVRPHGVHGAVKLDPLTDDVSRFKGLKVAYIEKNGEFTPVEILDAGVREDAVYATLSCSTSREDAEALRGVFLCVDREHTVKLPEGAYFVADIIGCDVVDTEGESFGRVTDVLQTGANDVYVIKGKRTLMLPALRKVLYDVDIINRRITLDKAVLEEVGLFED